MIRKTSHIARMSWTRLRVAASLIALSCSPFPSGAVESPSPDTAAPLAATSRPAKSEAARTGPFNDDQQGRLASLRDWLRKRSSERRGGGTPPGLPRIAAYRLGPPPAVKERRSNAAPRLKRQELAENLAGAAVRGFERGSDGRVRHRYQFGADAADGLETATSENTGEASSPAPAIHIGGKHYYRVASEIKLGTYGAANLSGGRSSEGRDQPAELMTGDSAQSHAATPGETTTDP